METHARAPEPLVKTNDMASNWHSWKTDFIIFMKVTGYINKPNEIRANLLKNRIGKVGIDAIQTMTFDKPEDEDDMDILITKLEEFFNPPKNEVVERFQFFTRDKKQNETMEQYINILREKAKTCNFNDMTDSIIRDKIILITQDKILRKKFFETKNLDLEKLVVIYNDYNINTEKMKELTKENINIEKKQVTKENINTEKKQIAKENINTEKKQVTKENNNTAKMKQVNKESTESTSSTSKLPINDTKKKCWRCNCEHSQGKCLALGSQCTRCGDMNHFTHCCKSPKPNPKPNDNKKKKKRNNLANSETKNMDPINKMISFPDIPTVPCHAANLTFSHDILDFVMLDECKPGPSVHSDVTNQPANLTISKNTQCTCEKSEMNENNKCSYVNSSREKHKVE